jgi:hypothetical protein
MRGSAVRTPRIAALSCASRAKGSVVAPAVGPGVGFGIGTGGASAVEAAGASEIVTGVTEDSAVRRATNRRARRASRMPSSSA